MKKYKLASLAVTSIMMIALSDKTTVQADDTNTRPNPTTEATIQFRPPKDNEVVDGEDVPPPPIPIDTDQEDIVGGLGIAGIPTFEFGVRNITSRNHPILAEKFKPGDGFPNHVLFPNNPDVEQPYMSFIHVVDLRDDINLGWQLKGELSNFTGKDSDQNEHILKGARLVFSKDEIRSSGTNLPTIGEYNSSSEGSSQKDQFVLNVPDANSNAEYGDSVLFMEAEAGKGVVTNSVMTWGIIEDIAENYDEHNKSYLNNGIQLELPTVDLSGARTGINYTATVNWTLSSTGTGSQ